MVQSTGEQSTRNINSKTVRRLERLSNESKRQREKPANTGAFGQRVGDSDLVFLEGILPEENGEVLNGVSIDKQALKCFDQLEATLDRRNATLEDILKVEVQLTDISECDAVDDVYQTQFDGEYPPRTTVGVCSLPGGAGIQLDVIAADE